MHFSEICRMPMAKKQVCNPLRQVKWVHGRNTCLTFSSTSFSKTPFPSHNSKPLPPLWIALRYHMVAPNVFISTRVRCIQNQSNGIEFPAYHTIRLSLARNVRRKDTCRRAFIFQNMWIVGGYIFSCALFLRMIALYKSRWVALVSKACYWVCV